MLSNERQMSMFLEISSQYEHALTSLLQKQKTNSTGLYLRACFYCRVVLKKKDLLADR